MAFYDELINQWIQDHPQGLSPEETASIEMGTPETAQPLTVPPLEALTSAPDTRTSTMRGAEISTFNPASARQRLEFSKEATKGMEASDAARAQESANAQLDANARQAALGVEAQRRVGEAEAEANRVAQESQQAETDLLNRQAIDVAAEEATNAAKVNQAFADWQAQSAKVSAMRVDPDRLMKNAGPTGRLGFGAAAFMEGFLGAKGIKIHAIDQINKRVDDDINAQLTDIEQGKETTAQFRMFYEAARQGAQDDRLVRDKLRAFYLASLKSQATANALGAKSKVDAANNFKLVTDIERQQVVNEANIQKGMYDQIQTQVNLKRELGVRYAGIANDRAKWQAEDKRIRDLAAGKQAEQQPVFVDPQTGNPIGEVRKGFETKAPEIQADAATVSAAVNRLRSIRDKFEKAGGRIYNGPLAGWLSSGSNRELFAEYQRAYLDLRRAATGTASSAKEDEAIKSGSPFPEFTGVSPQTAARIMNDRIGEELDKADSRLRSFSTPNTYSAMSPAWRLESQEYTKGSYESSSEALDKQIRGVGNNDPAPDRPGSDWKGFVNAGKNVPQYGGRAYTGTLQPQWASGLDTEVEAALAGSDVARQGLWLHANDDKIHPNRRAYAQYLLREHPELAPVTEDFLPRVNPETGLEEPAKFDQPIMTP